MLEMLGTSQFWVDVFKIIIIDILLSGDNAVVIALACRNLAADQYKKGIMLGVCGAIGLRIVLTFFALSLLRLPFLKVVGAILLLWIGVKLLMQKDEHDESKIKAGTRLWGAVYTIIIADFMMSLDNVLGVVAAVHGNVMLLAFGLLVSIPLIAWSSQLVMRVIKRFPLAIDAGGALLGYVAGEMLLSDPYVERLVEALPLWGFWSIPVFCALLVVGIGLRLAARNDEMAKSGALVSEPVSTAINGKQ